MIIIHTRTPKSRIKSRAKRQLIARRARITREQREKLFNEINNRKLSTVPKVYHRKSSLEDVPSLLTSAFDTSNHNIMDPVQLRKESPAVRQAIQDKAKRIALLYNKGTYGYVTDEMDIKTLGSRSRRS